MTKDDGIECAITTLWYVCRTLAGKKELTREERVVLHKAEKTYKALTEQFQHWTTQAAA